MEQKSAIIDHNKEMINWVITLREMPEDIWFQPIEAGKWSPAEIISHFVPWDEFILEKRLPYLFTDKTLPKGPENAEVFNLEAANAGRSNEKEVTIQKFITTRRELIKGIGGLSDDLWENTFKIGSAELHLFDYFKGLIDHDLHHKQQIDKIL